MKRKSGKPHAKALHQPVPELVAAESIPEEKRIYRYNTHRKPRRETAADYFPSLGMGGKIRRQMSDAEYQDNCRDLAVREADEADSEFHAAKEAAEEPITPPGLPLPVTEHAGFVTEDCIRG